jgi:hypothetical protein
MPLAQFVVPLGISVVLFAIIGIYLHFRQRMNALNNKMDLLFQLIQEHTSSQNVQNNNAIMNKENLIAVSDDEGSDSDSESSDSDENETSDSEEEEEEYNTENVRSIDISSTLPVISLDNLTVSVNKLDTVGNQNFNSGLGEIEELVEEVPQEENEDDDENEEVTQAIEQSNTISNEVKAELNEVNYSKFTVAKLKELVDKFGLVKSSGKMKRAQLINILDSAKL